MRGLEDLPDLRARVAQLVEAQQVMIDEQRLTILELRIQVDTLMGALRKITGAGELGGQQYPRVCRVCATGFETARKHGTLCAPCASRIREAGIAQARATRARNARAVGVAQT